jgi:hypothetical protein
VPVEIRRLIREMSLANPMWGAPRIHGELLKLGIDIGQTSAEVDCSCAKTAFIEPGSPWEHGYCESFNSKLRDEMLNSEIFYSLAEAKVIIEAWRRYIALIQVVGTRGHRLSFKASRIASASSAMAEKPMMH